MTSSLPLNFLFATIDAGGAVPPMLAVAAKLAGRGHRVRVISEPANQRAAVAAGAAFAPWSMDIRAHFPAAAAREQETRGAEWAFTAADQELRTVQILLGMIAGATARDLGVELDREKADLVVCLDMMHGVMVGCEARGQPHAIFSAQTSVFPIPGVPPLGPGLTPARSDADRALHAQVALKLQAVLDAGLEELNAARADLGLRPIANVADLAAATVNWLATARAFDFAPATLPAHVRYAGPQITDPDWAAAWTSPWPQSDRRPLVLVGFSTTFQNHLGVLQRVMDAASELPLRLLVTTGPAISPSELAAPANAVVVESAPHTAVMPLAALVVTHGGHGTVMKALVNRLPMLLIPHGRDQDDNAVRVTERGAGLALPNTATTVEIGAALRRLLDEQSFREAARKLGDAVALEAEHSDSDRRPGSPGVCRSLAPSLKAKIGDRQIPCLALDGSALGTSRWRRSWPLHGARSMKVRSAEMDRGRR